MRIEHLRDWLFKFDKGIQRSDVGQRSLQRQVESITREIASKLSH
jgi:hypothetical protein